jgi:hypothetical protein
MAKCVCHICECKAKKLEALERENRRLLKDITKYGGIANDVNFARQLRKTLKQVDDLLVPFITDAYDD